MYPPFQENVHPFLASQMLHFISSCLVLVSRQICCSFFSCLQRSGTVVEVRASSCMLFGLGAFALGGRGQNCFSFIGSEAFETCTPGQQAVFCLSLPWPYLVNHWKKQPLGRWSRSRGWHHLSPLTVDGSSYSPNTTRPFVLKCFTQLQKMRSCISSCGFSELDS